MKTEKVALKSYSLDFRKSLIFIKRNAEYISLMILFVCGLTAGSVLVCNSENLRFILSIFLANETGFLSIFANGILRILLMLTLNFSVGLSLVGSPFVCIASVIEGVCISAVYTYHLYTDGYDSIAAFFFLRLIFIIIEYLLFAVSGFISTSMSRELKLSLGGKCNTLSLRVYLLSYLVIAATGLISVFIRALVNCI